MVHESAVEWHEYDHGPIEFRRRKLAAAADGDALGCSLHEVPPGKRTWPYHYHAGNEEALYVLAGTGTVRTPDGERAIEAGSYLAFPVGPDGAHRVINDGDETLRYLVVSEMADPDVTVYPDVEGLGVYVGSPPGGDENERYAGGYFEQADEVDFWTAIAHDAGRNETVTGEASENTGRDEDGTT